MGRKFSASTALALAAVLLSSSTAVFAVAALPKHSVGKKQLKKSAVTNKKIAPGAVTADKVASGTFVAGTRMAFGKGFANSVPARTVLSLPSVHASVSTDGTADTAPTVVVHLPAISTFAWFVNSSWETQTFSTMGGAVSLSAQLPATGTSSREFTAHIWRSDTAAAIYLHCVFDTDGFSTAGPLSCMAMSS